MLPVIVVLTFILFIVGVVLIILWNKVSCLENKLDDTSLDWQAAAARLHEELSRGSLTRDDALLLIDDALSIVTKDVTKHRKEYNDHKEDVFYFGRPTAERMFDDEYKRKVQTDTTFYRFIPSADDKDWAQIELCLSAQGEQIALRDVAGILYPVCEVAVSANLKDGIRQVEKGLAIRRNGFWTVAKKVKIGAKS